MIDIVSTIQVKMMLKLGFFLVTAVVGSFAVPATEIRVVDLNTNEFPADSTPEVVTGDLHIHAFPALPRVEVRVNPSAQVESIRIVGGSVADDGSAPYMAALSIGWIFRSLMCGGSLISERYVLTAAHCVDALYIFGSLSRSLRITVGTNRWNHGGQMYSVARNVTHQNYQPSIIKNDIALLVTKSKVHQTEQVVPVALSFEFIDDGVVARAVGWGRTKHMGPISNKLLELTVETISGQQCVEAVANGTAELDVDAPHVDPEIELCTLHSSDHGMCNGDSGSALVRKDSGQQIGIVSWGLPCARGVPDVFLRISAFKDWIEQNVDE